MTLKSGYRKKILNGFQKKFPAAGHLFKRILGDRKLRILLITSLILIKAITLLIFLMPVL